MPYIDRSKKPRKLRMFLAKPDRSIQGEISVASDKIQTIKYGKINELTFDIPFELYIKNSKKTNPIAKKLRENFLVKVLIESDSESYEEWYIITKRQKSMNDNDLMSVTCFSLGYQLTYKKMIAYEAKSYNCEQVLTDCLKGTNWSIGYINPIFNEKHRQFDVSSKNKLEFLYEICETFEAIPTFDTVTRKVNIYKEDEVSKYRGFLISYGKYLQSIDEEMDLDQICTRLFVHGNEDASINSVNPTGQSYIDDFSYYTFPFERDADRNVLKHSDSGMSDDLCHAILDYNELLDENKNVFSIYLNNKETKQNGLTVKKNELRVLNDELQIILDNIEIVKSIGQSSTALDAERDSKQNEIDDKKSEISTIENEISTIDSNIKTLSEQVDFESNFTGDLLTEINDYIFMDEFSDDNQTTDFALYEKALEHHKEINSPPISMSISIVNFFEIIEEQFNWNRFGIGDIIKVQHDKLGIDVTTRVTEIRFNYDDSSIGLTVSNTKRAISKIDKWSLAFNNANKTKKDYELRKPSLNSVIANFNSRNDRISTPPTLPTLNEGQAIKHRNNDDGTIDLIISWNFPDYATTNNDADFIDGFIIYLYSSTSDGKYTFGSTIANEATRSVESTKRSVVFNNVSGNVYHTVGIRSYRKVDSDISPSGYINSDIVSSKHESENPYLANSEIEMTGRLNGIKQTSSHDVPLNPTEGEIWIDKNSKRIKQFSNGNWDFLSPSQADEIGAETPESVSNKISDAFNTSTLTGKVYTTGQNGTVKIEEDTLLTEKITTLDSITTKLITQMKNGTLTFEKNIDNVLNSKIQVLDDRINFSDQNNTNTITIKQLGDKIQLPRIVQDSFVDATLQNGCENYSLLGYENAGYMKDSQGFIHLRGTVKNFLTDTVIFNLPIGYRPSGTRSYVVRSFGTYGEIEIFTNGDVMIVKGDPTFLYLNIPPFK